MAGLQGGVMTGAAVPLLRRMFPNNPDAAQLMGQGALMPFPLGLPAMIGAGAMFMGAKPTPTNQLVESEPSGGSY